MIVLCRGKEQVSDLVVSINNNINWRDLSDYTGVLFLATYGNPQLDGSD